MTTATAKPGDDLRDDRRDKAQEKVNNVIFVLLLMLLAGRCFLGELPFRTSAVQIGAGGQSVQVSADYTELTRISFAVCLLALAGVWLAASATTGRIPVRRGYLIWLVGAFAFWSLGSALLASDTRSALTGWCEQFAILTAGILAVQLCADKRRFLILLVVLTGLAGAMAAQGAWQVFVEAPDRIEDFQLYRLERLAEIGIAPDSPQAAAFEARLSNRAPFGFFSLSNVFASLMVRT